MSYLDLMMRHIPQKIWPPAISHLPSNLHIHSIWRMQAVVEKTLPLEKIVIHILNLKVDGNARKLGICPNSGNTTCIVHGKHNKSVLTSKAKTRKQKQSEHNPKGPNLSCPSLPELRDDVSQQPAPCSRMGFLDS